MQISDAIQAVLKAEEDFRDNMHRDWEGDPLSDAIDTLRAAFAASQDAPASEPVAWCQPNYEGKVHPRKFMVVYEDAEMGNAVFEDEAEAREHFEKASVAWNCYLFGLLPRLAAPAVPASAVRVKPLDLANLLKHAFMTGAGIPDLGRIPDDTLKAWMEYDPEPLAWYQRIISALAAPVPQATEGWDNPDLDATDGAHPAWWRGNDAGVETTVRIVNEILDGKRGASVYGYTALTELSERLAAALTPKAEPAHADSLPRSHCEAAIEAGRRLYMHVFANDHLSVKLRPKASDLPREELARALWPGVDSGEKP